jgi:hypothetical protein
MRVNRIIVRQRKVPDEYIGIEMTQLTTISANRIKSPNNDSASPVVSGSINRVKKLNREAEARWADKLWVDNSITRSMVSFQANKSKLEQGVEL